MSDLVEFLLARIAEDEAIARAAGGQEWHVRGDHEIENRYVDGPGDFTIYDEGGHDEHQAAHIARNDPRRVLAECEAKRRIVDAYREFVEPDPDDGFAQFADDTPEDRTWPEYGGGMFSGLREAVRALAAVYADHPLYRPEWRL